MTTQMTAEEMKAKWADRAVKESAARRTQDATKRAYAHVVNAKTDEEKAVARADYEAAEKAQREAWSAWCASQ